MASLNELISRSTALEEMIFEAGGEISPEVEEQMAATGRELKEKIDCYAMVAEHLKMRKTYAFDRMQMWKKVLDAVERGEENLLERLQTQMQLLGTDEVHGLEYSVKVQKNPPKVNILDEAKIPGEFIVTETKTSINKREILDAMKDGRDVPGCEIQRTTRLAIKPSQRKLT